MAKEKKVAIEVLIEEVDELVEICEHATAFCQDAGLPESAEKAKVWRKSLMAIAAKAREMRQAQEENTRGGG